MQKIAIIIPCYNEEKRIVESNISYLVENTGATIFFANDGSTDKTVSVLNNIIGKYPERCYLLNYKANEGKAHTIYKAVNELVSRNLFDYIGYFDADFSTPANEIKRLLEIALTNKYKFIFGSRVLLLNSGIKRKIYRHIIGRAIITLINLKFKLGIYDTQCGAKLFSVEIIQQSFIKPFHTSWLFDIEIFIRLKNAGLLYSGLEIPVYNWRDVDGSKLGYRTFLKILKELYMLWKKY